MRARVVVISMLLLGGASVSPSVARADDPPGMNEAEARERSRAAFRKGVAQLRAQDWAAARTSFETAWGYFPHPSILLNLGIARLHTDDPVRAEQDLMKFLSEDGGASADELAGAREALADARSKIGTVRVVVTPPTARVSIDGKAVTTVRRVDAGGIQAEVRAKAGTHAVLVEADGYKTERRDVDLAAKAEAVAHITLAAVDAPPPKPTPAADPSRAIAGYSLLGLAGAALITSGVTALRAKTLSNEYGDASSPHFQEHSTRTQGIAFRTTADVALGIALVSGAIGVVLLFTDFGKSPTAVARAGTLTW
jgi:hypothetical protein